jgi:hypothetical protein
MEYGGITEVSPNPRKSGAMQRACVFSPLNCAAQSERSCGQPWMKSSGMPLPTSSQATSSPPGNIAIISDRAPHRPLASEEATSSTLGNRTAFPERSMATNTMDACATTTLLDTFRTSCLMM